MEPQGFASTEITSVTCRWRRRRFYGVVWGRGGQVPLQPGSDRGAGLFLLLSQPWLSCQCEQSPKLRISVLPAQPGERSSLRLTASSPAPCWAQADTESGLSNPPWFPPGVCGSVAGRARAGAGPRRRGRALLRAAAPGCPLLPAPPGSCCGFGGPGSPGRHSSSSQGAPAAPSPAPGAS